MCLLTFGTLKNYYLVGDTIWGLKIKKTQVHRAQDFVDLFKPTDLWFVDGSLYLGHDEPTSLIDLSWIMDRQNNLWIHCKNTQVVSYLSVLNTKLNYFWHQQDILTLTSQKFIWVFPGKQPVDKSIAVLPELFNDDFSNCIGICSDFVKIYRDGSKPLDNLRS